MANDLLARIGAAVVQDAGESDVEMLRAKLALSQSGLTASVQADPIAVALYVMRNRLPTTSRSAVHDAIDALPSDQYDAMIDEAEELLSVARRMSTVTTCPPPAVD